MVDPSLTRVAQLATDGAVSLHFWYALQADPDVMLEIVSTGSPNRTQAWDAYFARLDDAAAEAARRDAYVEPGKFFSADTRAALEGVGFTITETSESAALELEGERFEVRWDERTEPGLPARMIRVGAEASDDPLAFHAWASAGDDAARIVMQLAGEARRARRGLSAYRWPKDFRVTELVEHHWGYRWEYGGLARIVDFGWQKDAVARFIAISATPLTDAAAFYNPDER
jgi:hypothetical protein